MTQHQIIKRLQAKRKELGVTYNCIAENSGMNYSTVHQFFCYEVGTIKTMEKIAFALGYSLTIKERGI